MATYEQWINRRLTEVYRATASVECSIASLRLVLVSDLHKGQRDGADDFQQCEKTYLAALQHYWQTGYELALLGDIEELWECRPKQVIAAYANVLITEKDFSAAANPSRYWRIIGNHDDEWYDRGQVRKHLGGYLDTAQVVEGLRLRVTDDQARPLGELYLVHGHQGTILSDRYRRLSAVLLRYLWRPIQRLLRFKNTSPSNNFELKGRHERAMYAWASDDQQWSVDGPVLIAGHTHHPVWFGMGYEQALEVKDRAENRTRAADEQRWIAQEIGGRIELPGEKPCYFNTGCCSFSDGSITALEIADGEIRLVRWRASTVNADAASDREVLFLARLADVFAGAAAG